jgi:hypothetical protein
MSSEQTAIVVPGQIEAPSQVEVIVQRPSRKRLILAFAVAGISDIISFFTEFIPPVQWGIDGLTALALFLILGRRWALLPGLVAEVIPGVAIFPVWILVVLSIFVYDDIRGRKRT